MATKNSKWWPKIKMESIALERHLSGNFSFLFGCKMFDWPEECFINFDPEIQDGVEIQNATQKRKNLIFDAK
jgi:hypothetical protein